MNIIEYPDREMMLMHVADVLAGVIKNDLVVNEAVSIAVPGGSTPGPIFDTLAAMHLDWDRVHVMLTDERWVPESDARSNTAMIRERLLTDQAAAAHFVPFYQDGLSAAEGCAQVQESLVPHMPLSLLVLGMGADMHTASLFPGADGLAEAMASDAPLLCPVSPPDQDIQRVTLSAAALRGAIETHVVITGDDKRAALERAQHLKPVEAPIAAVLGGGTVHWAA